MPCIFRTKASSSGGEGRSVGLKVRVPMRMYDDKHEFRSSGVRTGARSIQYVCMYITVETHLFFSFHYKVGSYSLHKLTHIVTKSLIIRESPPVPAILRDTIASKASSHSLCKEKKKKKTYGLLQFTFSVWSALKSP